MHAVYVAHGTFNWQDTAAAYKEAVSMKAQQQQQQKQQQKQQQDGKAQIMSGPAAQQSTGTTGAWPTAAVKAAFKLDRRPTRDHRTTAAVNDAKTLFPSKLKELGKGKLQPGLLTACTSLDMPSAMLGWQGANRSCLHWAAQQPCMLYSEQGSVMCQQRWTNRCRKGHLRLEHTLRLCIVPQR